MTEHVKLIEAEVSKTLSEVEADWAKCAEDAKVTKKVKEPIFSTILGYTEHKIILCGNQITIHRVFVRTLDSEEYFKLGWVLKTDVNNCMICTKALTKESGMLDFLDWSAKDAEKKHCFACGNIVCSSCSNSGTTVVREILKLGAVTVCTQCSWGQDEVGITVMPQPPTYKIHQKIQAATGGSPTKGPMHSSKGSKLDGSVDVSSKGKEIDLSIPRIWKYGNVHVDKITPVFSFEARNKDKAIVYINVTTNPLVPFNLHPDNPQKRNALLAKKNQDLMLVVGEKGISALTEGAFVYDVVIHPSIIPLCSADATGVLKEKVCAEILRSIRRMGIESEFALFAYRPASIVYNQRHFTYAEKLAASGDYEIWKEENKIKAAKAAQLAPSPAAAAAAAKKAEAGSFADIEDEEEDPVERERIIFSPMPSVSAFFHMEQIAVSRNDLKRPPGVHEKRWAKYDEIVQVADGSVYIPNNKRAKKQAPIIQHISQPVLLNETINEKQLDRYGNRLVTYTVSLIALNGFVITAPRAVSANAGKAAAALSKEQVMVHVLHHPFVDDFCRSGILVKPQDELDPLLMLCKKSVKVKKEDGTTVRAYNVVVGSSYIVGVDDLSGRRIVTPERVTKILRRINAFFEDTVDVQKYVLSGIDKRPTTDPAPVTLYSYERPLLGTEEEVYVPPVVVPAPAAADSKKKSTKQPPPPPQPSPSQQIQAQPAQHQQMAPRPSVSRDNSGSVVSDLTTNDFPYVPQGVASMSISRDSHDSGNQHAHPQPPAPGMPPSPSTKKTKLGFFFGGSKSTSTATVPQHAGSSSPSHAAQLASQPSEEYKGDSHGAHKLVPPPSPAHRHSTMGLPLGGIASMDDTSVSKQSSNGSANGHHSAVPTSPNGGLGMGAAKGLTLEVLVAQTKSQSRSRHSDTNSIHSAEGEEPVAQTVSPQRSIFLNQAPTPLHRDSSAPTSAPSSSTQQSPPPAPDSGRPPSQNYSGRPFSGMFFRESSDKKISKSVSRTASGPAEASPVLSSASTASSGSVPAPSASGAPAALASGPGSMHREAGINLHTASSGSVSHPASPVTPATPAVPASAPVPLASASTPRSSSGLAIVKTLGRKKSPLDMHGRDLVSADMLEYVVQASVNRAVAEGLSRQAVKDPKILFGWQIRVMEHMSEPGKGLYVVSAVKRSVIGIYDYRLTNLLKDDLWVKLKRGGQGEGLAFTAVRKVLAIDEA